MLLELIVSVVKCKDTRATLAVLLGPAQRKCMALDVKSPTTPIQQQDWYRLWNKDGEDIQQTFSVRKNTKLEPYILFFEECATTAAGWGVTSLLTSQHCVVDCMLSCCCLGDAAVVRWDLSASVVSPEHQGSNDEKKRRIFPKHLRAGSVVCTASEAVQAVFILIMDIF